MRAFCPEAEAEFPPGEDPIEIPCRREVSLQGEHWECPKHGVIPVARYFELDPVGLMHEEGLMRPDVVFTEMPVRTRELATASA